MSRRPLLLLTAACPLPPAACWAQAAALLLCEVFLVGAATAGAEVMDIASLKRLLFDVFHEDVGLFKEYCVQVGSVCV